MNLFKLFVFSLIFLASNSMLYAQEKKFKKALDSVAFYIKKTSIRDHVNMLTYYNPGSYDGMAEKYDSSIYLKMAYNYKTKVVFTDGSIVYMIDFKEMDTSFISFGRRLKIKDPNGKIKFRHSAESRLFNGKLGGVPIDEIEFSINYSEQDLTFYKKDNFSNAKKLVRFLKEATLYSKKVKMKKKDIWKAEGYD